MVYNHEKLTKSKVLSEIDQQEVFTKIFNVEINFDNNYTNPLRKDENAGCRFFIKNGELKFKDFSNGDSLNCIDIVMKIYQLSFNAALEYLYYNKSFKSVNPQ